MIISIGASGVLALRPFLNHRLTIGLTWSAAIAAGNKFLGPTGFLVLPRIAKAKVAIRRRLSRTFSSLFGIHSTSMMMIALMMLNWRTIGVGLWRFCDTWYSSIVLLLLWHLLTWWQWSLLIDVLNSGYIADWVTTWSTAAAVDSWDSRWDWRGWIVLTQPAVLLLIAAAAVAFFNIWMATTTAALLHSESGCM